MNKRDLIIIFAVLALALGIWGASALFRPSEGEYSVVVYVGGEQYARSALKDNLITVTQEDGSVNVIEISKEGVRMQSASCENQLCVHQGWVLMKNSALTDLGGWIICLPNGVSVELRSGKE